MGGLAAVTLISQGESAIIILCRRITISPEKKIQLTREKSVNLSLSVSNTKIENFNNFPKNCPFKKISLKLWA